VGANAQNHNYLGAGFINPPLSVNAQNNGQVFPNNSESQSMSGVDSHS
jgi:hypothetical protein